MVELIWEELKEFILGWYYSDKHCHLFKKYSKKTTTFCLQWGGVFEQKLSFFKTTLVPFATSPSPLPGKSSYLLSILAG